MLVSCYQLDVEFDGERRRFWNNLLQSVLQFSIATMDGLKLFSSIHDSSNINPAGILECKLKVPIVSRINLSLLIVQGKRSFISKWKGDGEEKETIWEWSNRLNWTSVSNIFRNNYKTMLENFNLMRSILFQVQICITNKFGNFVLSGQLATMGIN